MKIAMLIQCHKNAEQINLLLDAMRHPAITFFIHVDKKVQIADQIVQRDDVFILPDALRVDVKWAGISQIDATLNLLRFAKMKRDFDFYWLCSGQDFPIKSTSEIVSWFQAYPRNDFLELFSSKNSTGIQENKYDKRTAIYYPQYTLGTQLWKRIIRRVYVEISGGYNKTFRWVRRKPVNGMKFYFGSQWICLSGTTWNWIDDYLNTHPEYYQYFINSNCPDEGFFQTLVMNSPYAQERKDYLHYVDWSEGKSNPKLLRTEDYSLLLRSSKLIARKFDITVDNEIVNELLEKQIRNGASDEGSSC